MITLAPDIHSRYRADSMHVYIDISLVSPLEHNERQFVLVLYNTELNISFNWHNANTAPGHSINDCMEIKKKWFSNIQYIHYSYKYTRMWGYGI